MKISIITATYNSASTVRDTLASIAKQTYRPIEHIIVDGLSSDETLQIVREFPHVDLTIAEKDSGIYDAMNKGILHSTGEIVGILNSDDVYTSDTVIERVMKLFEDNTVDAVYGDLQYVDKNNLNRIVRTWKAGQFERNKFFYGWMPPHPSFFVRKEAYQKWGMFNLQLRSAADYEIMLRFLFRYNARVKYLPGVLVKMRVGGVSNNTLRNRIKANREDRLAWKLNNLSPKFFTLILKPLRKINQFLIR